VITYKHARLHDWGDTSLATPVTNVCTSGSRRLRISEAKTTKSDGCRFSEAIETRDVFSSGCSPFRPDAEEEAAANKRSRKTTLSL